jgi:hypothetical protein
MTRLIEPSFSPSLRRTAGNFEAVVRVPGIPISEPDTLDFWFLDSKVGRWNGPFPLIADGQQITGVTGF